MKLKKKTLLGFFIACSILLAGILLVPVVPYLLGKIEAQRDVNRGQLIIKTCGLPVAHYGTAVGILKQEYNIELVPVAGCVVTEELRRRIKGYNEVSNAAIEKKYGPGLVHKVFERAELEYKLSMKK